MNRTILTIAGVFTASSLLLVDSAVKGTALLMFAVVLAVLLRRDSAATRHLVWLLTIVALVAVPMLSALLPQWRVLPEWANVAPTPVVVAMSPPSVDGPGVRPGYVPQTREPDEVELPAAAAVHPPALLPQTRPPLVTPDAPPAPAAGSWNWLTALPIVWAIGFGVLILRLMAARWMLWNSERQATVVGSSGQLTKSTHDPIETALEAGCLQLGISRSVTVLIHPDKTIPVVWGILRSRLLLPIASRNWSGEQLRSVLLHELAHVKRRDSLAQLLTQFACVLHWFNPLVWFAAWRLSVERERACDDLVLASGVRPSAYAGHLLEVVTGLSPVRWTHPCGLAMARKSSLEGRLVAVLSNNLNRRRVPMALAATALAIAVGIAVPIAMLGASAEKPSEKQKPSTTDMKPKDDTAGALFKKWQASARTDGKIPGGLIGLLAAEIDSFVRNRPQDEKSARLKEMRPRLDASRDWTQADAVALLDDITAISTTPVVGADHALLFGDRRIINQGQPLSAELKNVAWGVPVTNGLRGAWLLEPQTKQYALGTVLKARVLFHNTGKEPVFFQTESWHQNDRHKAIDAKGVDIKISGAWYTGVTPTAIYRLAPDEYCEVRGHGIAIGAGEYKDEFSIGSIGAVIEAKEGDDVTLTHSVDATSGGWTRPNDPKDPAELWRKNMAERVEREGPMPPAAADREQLIRRVTLDVFGLAASAEEIAAFVGDNAADALTKLTARLQAKPRIEPWSGKLPTGETIFRVTAADPNAANAPRAANAPGRYVLGDKVHLFVSQLTEGGKRTNTARMAFFSPDPKVASPHKPYKIALPDGIDTYGIVWQRGAGELWVMQKGLVRKYNFTDPANVRETRFEPGSILNVPEQLRDTLRKVFVVPDAPRIQAPRDSITSQKDEQQTVMKPKHQSAQALFKNWQDSARTDGKIPGGALRSLDRDVANFIKLNPTHEKVPQLTELGKRIDTSHDWTAADAVALLNDATDIYPTLPGWGVHFPPAYPIRPGMPLPVELSGATWGKPAANGLRAAWMLEPAMAQHRLGTNLKSRILFHNTGKETVVFWTKDWHQYATHEARDAKGVAIDVSATYWTRLSTLVPIRLASGDYAEVEAHAIAVGVRGKQEENWAGLRVGAWIEAKEGDEVTFQPAAVDASENETTMPADRKSPAEKWKAMVRERIDREGPIPAAAADREKVIRRVIPDLFGVPPTQEEVATFVADNSPDRLAALVERLVPRVAPFAGDLPVGEIKFLVTATDPEAAKKPRVVTGPGYYMLGERVRLSILQKRDGDRRVNEASILFYSPDPKAQPPGKPHEVRLPDGQVTWAAGWMRGATVFWVLQKGTLQSYDFTDPAKVKETTFKETGNLESVPQPILDALRAALDGPGASKSAPETPKKKSQKP